METVSLFISTNWFFIAISIWGVAAIANRSKRSELRDKLADIITQPALHVFNNQNNPNSEPIYTKRELEKIAEKVSATIIEPIDKLSHNWTSKLQSKKSSITDESKPWKSFGYLIFFVMIFFFIWADGIAIANTLEAIGLLNEIPEILTKYELAVAFGSFFTVIVGAVVMNELLAEKSEFSDWDQKSKLQKVFVLAFTVLIMLMGLLAVLALGMARYRLLVELVPEVDYQLEQFANFAILILIPINAVLATVLIHNEGTRGALIVILFFGNILLAIINFCLYLARIIGHMGIYGLDIILRITIAFLLVVAFFFFTPLDLLTTIISAPFSREQNTN
jgi:hypothetical protein